MVSLDMDPKSNATIIADFMEWDWNVYQGSFPVPVVITAVYRIFNSSHNRQDPKGSGRLGQAREAGARLHRVFQTQNLLHRKSSKWLFERAKGGGRAPVQGHKLLYLAGRL